MRSVDSMRPLQPATLVPLLILLCTIPTENGPSLYWYMPLAFQECCIGQGNVAPVYDREL
jgi:hypothetical protein